MTKWMYTFGSGKAQGHRDMRDILGGKGANLAEMANIGLPVPPGFTLTTEVCSHYYAHRESYPDDLSEQIKAGIAHIEALTDKCFGDKACPLLVSVRSGARVSMPGMMDTVLNLGLNDETVEGLAVLSGDRRFALDSYRRFIMMYGDVVLGVSHDIFESILTTHKNRLGVELDPDISSESWVEIIADYKAAVVEAIGDDFPQDVNTQLQGAIHAVFRSWKNERADIYRRINTIPESWGTAVNVQAMVFGNMGQTSATGVAFTRDPSTGAAEYYGEFLVNAQGEDVVAGVRTPLLLTRKLREKIGITLTSNDGDVQDYLSMEEMMPEVFAQLSDLFVRLESHYQDMQDIEFTVERGHLWVLQTRSAKRTLRAALKVATDMVAEGVLSRGQALMRLDPAELDQLLHPTIDPDSSGDLLAIGLPASPGAAIGEVVFDSETADQLSREGHKVILVRTETSPEDIKGMRAAAAIVTARGGMTSHAAVVTRGWGKACVCGVGDIRIDSDAQLFRVAGRQVEQGEVITVDGSSGQIFLGEVNLVKPAMSEDFTQVMMWADEVRELRVRCNAETPEDVTLARYFGAEGIGLCRTEHMFFEEVRLRCFREMILALDQVGRERALEKILPMQKADFIDIFKIMGDLPCTIRLLDPPLHEFLPNTPDEIESVARTLQVDMQVLAYRVRDLAETNPMLGHRGCRLGISFPEIYRMQVRAIFEAQIQVGQQSGVMPAVEIMIPLVSSVKELVSLRAEIESMAAKIGTRTYKVGTMIELPRAALLARDIAAHADFFSFGTNDLTQMTYGLSRDDFGKFLPDYVAQGIIEKDPFMTLDQSGVGDLVKMACQRGREGRADIKLGICGEHGGDPDSIEFCHQIGLDYVSCSPYRVPIARLAAAQVAIKRARR